MTHIEEQVVDGLRVLPLEKQQKVLDFVEALRSNSAVQKSESIPDSKTFISFAEAAHKYIGSVDSGHTDLSTNKKHMEDFGKV